MTQSGNPPTASSGSRPLYLFWVSALFLLYILSFMHPALRDPSLTVARQDFDYFFPFKYYWMESLKEGQPAFWNPYLMMGSPYMANLEVGAFSPFNLLFFLFPYSVGFTLGYILHFLLAAAGTYLLLRRLDCDWHGSFFGALSFSFCSFFFIHANWGQHSLLGAVSWLPWILFFLHRALEEKRLWLLALCAACLSLCFLEGYTQITVYAFMVVGLYCIFAWLCRRVSWSQALLGVVCLSAGFVLLTAAQLVPALELLPKCVRSLWGHSETMDIFVSPPDLLNFVRPAWTRIKEVAEMPMNWKWMQFLLMNYIGLIPLVFFLAGLVFWRGTRFYVFFLFLAVFFTLLALNKSTPFTQWLFTFFYDYLPFFKTGRYPYRMMAFACFGMACAAGFVLSALCRHLEGRGPAVRRWGLWLVRLAIVLTALDLWGWHPVIRFDKASAFMDSSSFYPPEVWDKVINDAGRPRMMAHWEQDRTFFYKVSAATTKDRLFLKDLGTFLTDDYQNTPLADLISLKYVQKFEWKPSEKWKCIRDDYFFNTEVYPRAFLAGGFEVSPETPEQALRRIEKAVVDARGVVLLGEKPDVSFVSEPGAAGAAEITDYRNNRVEISLNASRPCFLFLSDTHDGNWKAWVDGRKAPLYRSDGVFRAVPIATAGSHRVVMKYHPPFIYASLVVSLLAWAALLLFLLKGRGLSLAWPRKMRRLARAVAGFRSEPAGIEGALQMKGLSKVPASNKGGFSS